MTQERACASCGAAMAEAARFCGVCGAATRRHARQVAQRGKREQSLARRAGKALGIACGATLLGLIWAAQVVESGDEDTWATVLPLSLSVWLAALAAGLVDGPLRASLPWRTRPVFLLLAVPATFVTLGFTLVYLQLLFGDLLAAADERPVVTLPVWVAVVVLAPLGEEWLCRGVAYRAAATLSSPRMAILLSAILFAFLHGLGGGYLIELPHRFVMGLVAGWLRMHSGSLLPGIALHALHNFVAITWL